MGASESNRPVAAFSRERFGKFLRVTKLTVSGLAVGPPGAVFLHGLVCLVRPERPFVLACQCVSVYGDGGTLTAVGDPF